MRATNIEIGISVRQAAVLPLECVSEWRRSELALTDNILQARPRNVTVGTGRRKLFL